MALQYFVFGVCILGLGLVVSADLDVTTTTKKPFECGKNEHAEHFCTRVDCQSLRCVCDFGFERNDQRVCVPTIKPSEVTTTTQKPLCGENERSQTVCNRNGCFGHRCVCDFGFERNDQGVCVPSSTATSTDVTTTTKKPFKCGKNEHSEHFCTRVDCQSLRCVCDFGFERNDQGVCVPSSPATSTAPSGATTTTQKPLCGENERSQTVCNRNGCFGHRCVCDFGFERNDQGVCVPTSPAKSMNSLMRAKLMTKAEEPVKCPEHAHPKHVCYRTCYTGCACDDGYVSTDQNTCVPKASEAQ